MRKFVWFIVLIPFWMGCAREFPPETQELLNAIFEIPFPPGHDNFSFDDADTPTSYHVSAEYKGKTVQEIADHYHEFFSENGWTTESATEVETPALLVYDQGKSNVIVTIMDMPSTIKLFVIYTEYEYTREEFAVAIKKSAAPDAMQIVERVLTTCAGLKSYADTGRQESIHRGDLLSKSEFETKFIDNGDLLLQYSDELVSGFKTSTVLSKVGNVVQTMASYKTGPEQFADASMAITTGYGATSGVSGNIPELLLGLESKRLFELVNLKTLEESELEDGTTCVRLQGKNFIGDKVTVWIGKDTNLIRKIEEVIDTENYETTTYTPRINIEITADEMKFHPPQEI